MLLGQGKKVGRPVWWAKGDGQITLKPSDVGLFQVQ